jgi:iron complex transport system ATP-binding protein
MENMALIAFENVTVRHEETVALAGVTFRVEPGDHVAILGPNGSGKSSLIQAVTREKYPVWGDGRWKLQVMDRDLWRLFDLRALLGIVTNDLVEKCTRPYTALETALSGFFGSVGIWPNHAVEPWMEEKAREWLEFFDIGHLASRPLNRMSSGEVRRAVFARALAHEPRALILDEPTNSLDVRAQREVRESMSKLAARGVTIVLVTHHLPDIIPEIGRVITLKHGRVFDDGPKAEVLTGRAMSRLFDTEVEVAEIGGYYHMW